MVRRVQRWSGMLAVCAVAIACDADVSHAEKRVHLRAHDWTASIDPQTLRVWGRRDGRRRVLIARAVAGERLGRASGVRLDGTRASWAVPERGLKVAAHIERGRLAITIASEREQVLNWPRVGASNSKTLIIPSGEGLFLPTNDRWWQRELKGKCLDSNSGALTLPFFATRISRHAGSANFILASDLGNELCFGSRRGRLSAHLRHTFSAHERSHKTIINLTNNNPLAAAFDYRRWLKQHGQFVSLARKAHANPQIKKLYGAFHAYIWGSGRSPKTLRALHKLGIKRMWLGYDGNTPPVTRAFTARAKKLGFLIGPYRTFDNAQPASTADTPESVWPGALYPDGCARDAAGKLVPGFAGRGCTLSSQALAQRELGEHHIARRRAQTLRSGANSVFVDVDAAGELIADYSPTHPMTKEQDRANRTARLQFTAGRDLVLGSEAALPWAVPQLALTHGISVYNEKLWQARRSGKFGEWWPPQAPAIFFKPYKPSAAFRKAKYDPRYRIPLYQAVFHDAIIATDRWELPYTKLPSLFNTRALLDNLYNVPPIWHLNAATIERHREQMQKLYRFFSPIHRHSATLPLTHFEWLTRDHLVQRTKFGDAFEITANFSWRTWHGVGGRSVMVRWLRNTPATSSRYYVP